MNPTSSTYWRSEPGDDDHPVKVVVKMTEDICSGKTWQTRQRSLRGHHNSCYMRVALDLGCTLAASEELTKKYRCLGLTPGCPNSVSQG